jgi:hypothetical protein
MTVQVQDLLGAWRLVSWSLVYDDGRASEHPLGGNAVGIIMYTADGHVSATLMRATGEAPEPGALAADCFAYAGRFAVRDGTAFHSIEMSTNGALVGITSTRHIHLEGDTLTLSGPDFAAGSPRTQRIVWRRAVAKA